MMKNMHISNDNETTDVSAIPPPEKKRKGRGKTTGLSSQKKRKKNDNGKLKVIIPPDRTVAVGPGAKDFITELSVKVLHNARHGVKNWKGVPDLAKNRIVAYTLDTFQLPDIQHNRDTILQTAKNLYRYRRSRHHDHFKKFSTKEESLQNIPTDVNETEWNFLVDYFSSDEFKKMSERNKNNKAKQEVNHICGRKTFQAVSYEARNTTTGKEPNFQKLWEITHMKPNGQWVTSASAEVNDKVKDVIAEKIQDIDEGTDVDPIINAAFVQIMGEKSKYILGKGSGINSASRISRNEIQEQLRAQQKEAEEERYKRESVDIKLMEVKNQLEEERKNREVMEFRLVHDQKLLKESMMVLVSHLKNPKNDLPASIFNIFTTSTTSNETSSACLMNNNWEDLHVKKNQESRMQKVLDNLKDVLNFEKQNLEMAIYDCDKFNTLCNEKDVELKDALTEKRNLEMRLPKLSSQGSKKTTPKELIDANNQVFDKIHEELKARCMLRTAEETKKRLLSEKSSLEEKIVEIEKKKSSEICFLNISCFTPSSKS
ncbi:uncharacterized protein [Solanum lycopersicum]|nr:uncharacterized protein LOC101262998 [Solanum lycopersicum]